MSNINSFLQPSEIFAAASSETSETSPSHPGATGVILNSQALDAYLKNHLSLNANLNKSNNVLSFTKGFILGQFSVIICLVIFIKFFVFSESVKKTNSNKSLNKLITKEVVINGNGISKKGLGPQSNTSASEADEDDKDTVINTILEKTYYDVAIHQTESLDWFNVLVAQIITQFRAEALYENNMIDSLNEFLAQEKNTVPDWLDSINVKEINIGNDFPIFSNCRIVKRQPGKLEAKIDVDLSDTLTLAIETKILINKPKLLTAALPIKLSVSIVRFLGCLSISFDSEQSESPSRLGGVLRVGFGSDYRLEFKTESLIGARSKLENVPRISYLIENQLQNWFVERCVEPRFQLIPLPNMWPRKRNTREEGTR